MHWQGGQVAISVMVLGWGSRCPRFQLDLESKLKISWDTKFSSTFKSNYLLYFMETLTNVSTNQNSPCKHECSLENSEQQLTGKTWQASNFHLPLKECPRGSTQTCHSLS